MVIKYSKAHAIKRDLQGKEREKAGGWKEAEVAGYKKDRKQDEKDRKVQKKDIKARQQGRETEREQETEKERQKAREKDKEKGRHKEKEKGIEKAGRKAIKRKKIEKIFFEDSCNIYIV